MSRSSADAYRAWGFVLGDDIEGDYSTLAQVRDPDDNLLTLATPPSRPFPPCMTATR
jgi:hypothetical protein